MTTQSEEEKGPLPVPVEITGFERERDVTRAGDVLIPGATHSCLLLTIPDEGAPPIRVTISDKDFAAYVLPYILKVYMARLKSEPFTQLPLIGFARTTEGGPRSSSTQQKKDDE
jgi:hypothetical protein